MSTLYEEIKEASCASVERLDKAAKGGPPPPDEFVEGLAYTATLLVGTTRDWEETKTLMKLAITTLKNCYKAGYNMGHADAVAKLGANHE